MTKLALIAFLFFAVAAKGQQKYWIYFKDKCRHTGSSGCVSVEDLALNEKYLTELKKADIAVLNSSRWLNAVSATLHQTQLKAIQKLEFVDRIIPISKQLFALSADPVTSKKSDQPFDAYTQIRAHLLKEQSLSGKGVKVGVIDIGFNKADVVPELAPMFTNRQVIYKDFVSPKRIDFFVTPETRFDFHGTRVLQRLSQVASGPQFFLARTDHGMYEFRGEEDNWIAALEWMEGEGVRLVSTSLGYSTGFNNPDENHKPSEMNGKTTAIAKAAQYAINRKGMIIVAAAGNEGKNPQWQIVASPADGEDVISVGSVDENMLKTDVSSIGAAGVGYLKPDVSCYSEGGTSRSAPVISGLIACMLEKKPSLKNHEISEIIRKSGCLYPYGNNYVGYGVPDAARILALLDDPKFDFRRAIEQREKSDSLSVSADIAAANTQLVVFHKVDKWNVLKQEVVTKADNRFRIVRPKGAVRSTILSKDKVIEVFWN